VPRTARLPRLPRLARLRWQPPVLLLVAVLVAGAGVALAATMTPGPPAVTAENVTIDVPEGPGGMGRVRLDTTVYRPAATPAPAVLVAHGFGAARTQSVPRRPRWPAVGSSCSPGPPGDSAQAPERSDSTPPELRGGRRPGAGGLAGQAARCGPRRARRSAGRCHPGASYGGALALLLAGTDRRVDAVAAEITWNDLAQALFLNAASRASIPAATPAAGAFAPDGVFKRDWAGYFFGGAAAGSGMCGRFRPEVCAAYVQAATTGRPTPEIVSLLRRSSPTTVVGNITVPTLLIQGEHDTLFGLDQADATARELASVGAPLKVVWYAGGHDGGKPGAALQDQIGDWFDYHLRGVGKDPGTGFDYQVPAIFGTRRGIAPRTVRAQLDGLPRAVVVSALVGAGIGVEGVVGRHQLEEAFLQLVGKEAVE
jgi:ABC-2 type transport system ATP-binding protein